MSRTWMAVLALGWIAVGSERVVAQESVERQIREAVAPLSRNQRGDATVLGYQPGSDQLTVLRRGTNEFICLADKPGTDRFSVSCYHEDLEPFMARGRELRASGLSREEAQVQRDREIEAGTLKIANALLISLYGRINPATGRPDSVSTLRVLYMPHATVESTGLPAAGRGGSPWLMNPGTPRAHLMIPGERRAFRPDRRRRRSEHKRW